MREMPIAISATPPASPSMLSRRFSACTTPPNQTTASSVTGHGRLRPRDSVMTNTVSAPTMREMTSFASGDNCRRSSIMPRMSMAAADPGTASSNARSAGRFVSRTDAAVVASAAIANPTPPMLGCGDGVPPVFTRGCNQDGTPQSDSPDDGAEGKRQDRCEESQGEIGAQRSGNCTDLRRCRSSERACAWTTSTCLRVAPPRTSSSSAARSIRPPVRRPAALVYPSLLSAPAHLVAHRRSKKFGTLTRPCPLWKGEGGTRSQGPRTGVMPTRDRPN